MLTGFLIIGLGLIVVPHWGQWTWDYGISSEIGVALVIASILGFTIDRWMKAELRTDVFQASLGYVLQPEFRDEVSRIIGYKLICERHDLLVKIEKVSADTVKLTSSVERTIRNKSSYSEEIGNYVAVDEWGFSAGTSDILD